MGNISEQAFHQINMKRCSIIIIEMQIKTAMRYHCYLLELLNRNKNPKNLILVNAVKDMEQ